MRPKLPEGVQQGTYSVRPTSAGTLQIEVREFIGWWDTEQANFVKQVNEADPDLIRLSIASEGGFVSDALALHDFLKGHKARVEVEITGLTASAATIIAMAGDEVKMSDNALFLVHHASSGLFAWGQADDIEDAADKAVRGLRKINTRLLNIYTKRTGQNESDIDALMAKDEWLTADEALAWGFIDAVYEPAPDEKEDGEDSKAVRAIACAASPETLQALHLPALPQSLASKPKLLPSTLAVMDPKKTNAAPDAPAKTTEQTAATPKPDENDRLAHMEAELKRLKEDNAAVKAENERLAKERRESALNALKNEMAGRLPGTAVEEAVAFARAVDEALGGKPVTTKDGKEVTAIDHFKSIIASMPEHGLTRPVDTEPVKDEDAEVMAKAVKAM